MERFCKLLAPLLLALVLAAGPSAARGEAEMMEIEADITVEGIVVVMDDGVFLDDGVRLFLLIDMEDVRLEGMLVEVFGQYLLVDEMPAIKVQEMTVLDEGAASPGNRRPKPENDRNG
ncbi:hypothetical protein GKC30_02270 [Pseudodesulfovibrio sp. F-1]|uniref:Uncharacterized protein n=1 Tax=Pseudodesulfovibrio alkaliphilus TaxID=2661613 RepID=A0A7K1KK77_9BACT|nr:hypothetical protein [Pseudodesulfovibrio alkaliphilus]MUM76455.1 hypothetical protein [Pseudodesulfovibrio alkaliphilus]